MTTTATSVDELRSRFRNAKRVPQLLEVAESVRVAMRAASDAMDGEEGDGSGSAELTGLFAQLKGLLDEITAKLTRTATLDEYDRRAAGTPLRDGGEREWAARCASFSLFKACAAAIGLSGVDAGAEREVSAELVRRAGPGRVFTGNLVVPLDVLSVQVRHASPRQLRAAALETRVIGSTLPAGTTGGALIGTYTDPNQYIDVLRPAMVVRQAGARVLTGLTSNLRLPRMTQSAVPGWFNENSPIPVSDEHFDDITLTPHHDGGIVEITRNVLQQADPQAESLVRNDLALKLANDVDVAALAGTGVAPQPLGILHTPGVTALTAGATAYNTPIDLIGALATRNALQGSLAFVGDAAVMVASMKLLNAQAMPYAPEMLWHGYPQFWTTLADLPPAASHPLIFGNFNDLIIGFFSELDVLVNPFESVAYSKGNVQIRAAMTLDIGVRHPESFSYVSTGGVFNAEADTGEGRKAAAAPPAKKAA